MVDDKLLRGTQGKVIGKPRTVKDGSTIRVLVTLDDKLNCDPVLERLFGKMLNVYEFHFLASQSKAACDLARKLAPGRRVYLWYIPTVFANVGRDLATGVGFTYDQAGELVMSSNRFAFEPRLID